MLTKVSALIAFLFFVAIPYNSATAFFWSFGGSNTPIVSINSITACAANSCNFYASTNGLVGNAVVTLSNGNAFAGPFSIVTSGTATNPSGAPCPNNGNIFTISSDGAIFSTTGSLNQNYTACIAATNLNNTYIQLVSFNVIPVPISGMPTSALVADTATSGTIIVPLTVSTSTGASFIGQITASDPRGLTTVTKTGSVYNLVTTRQICNGTNCSPSDDTGGFPYNITLTATENNRTAQWTLALSVGTGGLAQCAGAPFEAVQAGLTTMALCNDWTSTIPNVAGTGLPTNWLGVMDAANPCSMSDTTKHIWYQTVWYLGCSPPFNETNGGIQVVTDPNYGNQALRVAYTVNDQTAGGSSPYQFQSMATMAPNFANNQDFPYVNLVEWTFRDNTEAQTVGAPNNDFWGWSFAAAQQPLASAVVLENDIFEDWGLNTPTNTLGPGGSVFNQPSDNGIKVWSCGVSGGNYVNPSGGTCPLPAGTRFSQYHTVGMLNTSDGTNIKTCAYFDHQFMGCGTPPGPYASGSGGPAQRTFLINWLGIRFNSSGYCPTGVDCLTQNLYSWVKSVRVWSCSDWAQGSTGPNPHCYGSTLVSNPDGSQTYTVPTQPPVPAPVSITFTTNPATIKDNVALGTTVSPLTVNMSDNSVYQGPVSMASCSVSPCPFAIGGSTGNWLVKTTLSPPLQDNNNISYTVSASNISSAQCGSPPAEAAAAGFTTMALCNDFTQAIPNTAGTGLPTNWLGVMDGPTGLPSCKMSDITKHIWYQTVWYHGCAPAFNEPGVGIQQVTDTGGGGNLALVIGLSVTDQNPYRFQSINTIAPNLANFQDYPQASFIQYVVRDDTEAETTGQPNNDAFTWTYDAAVNGTTKQGYLIEYDAFEDWGTNNGAGYGGGIPGPDSGVNEWLYQGGHVGGHVSLQCGVFGGAYVNPGGGGFCSLPIPGFTMTQYHTIGQLITTNGSNEIIICTFIDHAPSGCALPDVSNSGFNAFGQRNVLINWIGNGNNYVPGNCPTDPACINHDLHKWIKSIQVWSCSDWNNPSGANYTCKYPTLTNTSTHDPNGNSISLMYFHP